MTMPKVTRQGFLDMQVCVPSEWYDYQVNAFAETENPCGTENGWCIRRQGDERLDGADERVSCEKREGFVHMMLES